ncbi:MAG: transposase [Thaumarchaeota archaeon]|nr:transposase [Nitrososphaerota archaeon]
MCRKYNISPPTFYQWKEKFVEGGKTSLNHTSKGDVYKSLQKENESLKRLIGDLTVANDILKKTLEGSKR